jgi:hypothetical protein
MLPARRSTLPAIRTLIYSQSSQIVRNELPGARKPLRTPLDPAHNVRPAASSMPTPVDAATTKHQVPSPLAGHIPGGAGVIYPPFEQRSALVRRWAHLSGRATTCSAPLPGRQRLGSLWLAPSSARRANKHPGARPADQDAGISEYRDARCTTPLTAGGRDSRPRSANPPAGGRGIAELSRARQPAPRPRGPLATRDRSPTWHKG